MTRIFSLFLTPLLLWSVDGEAVFEEKCSSCHIKMISKEETLQRFDSLKAPPMLEVANRLKEQVRIKSEDADIHREVVIGFIKHYILYPDILYSMCDPVALDRFGQMPSMKGKLSEAERQAVAEWIYDYYEGKSF